MGKDLRPPQAVTIPGTAHSASEIRAYCQGEHIVNMNQLVILWRGRNPYTFAQNPDLYHCIAERSLRLGEPLLACDMIREGRSVQDHRELKMLHLRALTQSGAFHSALALIEELGADQGGTNELMHLKGKLHKYMGFSCVDKDRAKIYLERALDFYRQAYTLARHSKHKDRVSHAAINIATLSLLIGDRTAALRQVNEIIRDVEINQPGEAGENFWRLAVLGESYTIIGDLATAATYYQQAVLAARSNLVSITSMRRHAHFLLKHLGHDQKVLDGLFVVPTVACIVGLLVDHESALQDRFPAAIVPRLRRHIVRLIIRHNIEIGFCSAGAGGDLLFADELLKRNHEVNIVLPVPEPIFRRSLLELSSGSEWVTLYDQVLAKAATVTALADDMGTDDQAPFHYCTQVVEGMAALRAKASATKQINIVTWDGGDTPDIRGTAEAVARWHKAHKPFELISTRLNDQAPSGMAGEFISIRNKQEVRSILFADTVGFSKLSDRNLPLYVEHFIGAIPKIVTQTGAKHLYQNTWGDALFMVFATLDDAAEFALSMCDELSNINWRKKGLPDNLNFRIALHAGPVYELNDPLNGATNFYGYHVSQGARIEPITPPGEVYTSEGFAALLEAADSDRYVCDYVGRVPHAKGFGTFPIYHLKRMLY